MKNLNMKTLYVHVIPTTAECWEFQIYDHVDFFSAKNEVKGSYYAFRLTSKLCMVLSTSLVAHRMFSTSACLICCSLVSNTMYFHYVILICCKSCSETLDIYAVICLREMGLVPQWCFSLPVLCAEGIFSKPWLTYKALWYISTIPQQLCNLFKGYLDLFIHTCWVFIKCVAVYFKYSQISTHGTINLLHLQTLASLSSEYFASSRFLEKVPLGALYGSGAARDTWDVTMLSTRGCLDCGADRLGGWFVQGLGGELFWCRSSFRLSSWGFSFCNAQYNLSVFTCVSTAARGG